MLEKLKKFSLKKKLLCTFGALFVVFTVVGMCTDVNAQQKSGLVTYCFSSMEKLLESAPEEFKGRGKLLSTKYFISITNYVFALNQYENNWLMYVIHPKDGAHCAYAHGEDVLDMEIKEEKGQMY